MLRFNNKIAGIHHTAPTRLQWKNTLDRFGLRAQLLHAVLGSAVVFMLALGLLLDFIPPDYKRPAYLLHKGLGLWIFFLGLVWLLHWWRQATPESLPGQPQPLYRLAKLVHKILLFLCVAMPLSGWVMVSAGTGKPTLILPGFSLPAIASVNPDFAYAMKGVHITCAWLLLGLLALHVAGALYHHFYKRDPLLKRMIPRFSPPGGYYRFNFDSAAARARKQR